jgi:hypothetical protein
LRRSDADLEQAFFKTIATIGDVARNSTSLSASDCCFAFANTLSENCAGRLANMSEKPRFEGTPVVLLVFGESFRAGIGGAIVPEFALF